MSVLPSLINNDLAHLFSFHMAPLGYFDPDFCLAIETFLVNET